MKTAFELAALGDILKDGGLDVAEEGLKVLALGLIKWTEESLVLSETKMDDILVPFLEMAKPLILAQVDKVDGKEG